jgi:hypothetical protein
LAAITLKLSAHLELLILRHVAEVNAQEFETGLSALLNLQIGVAVARQDRQDGLDRG